MTQQLDNFNAFKNQDLTPIIGLPSGEVIDVTYEEVKFMKAQRLIKLDKRYDDFTFLDHNYKIILKILRCSEERTEAIYKILDRFVKSRDLIRINDDLSVNVMGDVDMSGDGLKKIPVKFAFVDGNFICKLNQFTDLENSPSIITGYFDCSINNIKTLVGGPKHAEKGYYCSHNNLTNLEGFPIYCNTVFDCSSNKLTTLKGMPEIIKTNYIDCSYNNLKNLSNGPKVTGHFNCSHNLITTLSNGIREVKGIFDCRYNKLFTIMGMPSCNKILFREGNEIEEIEYD
jgi:hypothetical protein